MIWNIWNNKKGDIGERAEALEGSLLNMFGLKRRPRPGPEKRQRIVIPEFLAELYRQQSGLEVDTTNLNLAGKLTQTANTVRTFAHQGTEFFLFFFQIPAGMNDIY